MPKTNRDLIILLKEQGVLKAERIARAMLTCPRKHFVPQEYLSEAYGNYPLPIGEGQTISQPLTVIFMLELLDVKPGSNVLEIGYGSGWQTAMLAHLVGKDGQVVAFEINSRLAAFGKDNLVGAPPRRDAINRVSTMGNITLHPNSYTSRFKKFAPYDRIVSGAAFSSIPQNLKESLKDDGILVAPTAQNDIRVIKKKGATFEERIIPGFVFVPIKNSD